MSIFWLKFHIIIANHLIQSFSEAPKEDIKDTLAKLSPEQLAELKEQILKMEAPKAEEEPKAEEAPKEEAPAAAEEPAQETTEE